MIKTHTDGMHYTIPQEWADKIEKYDSIVELLEQRSPYEGNRETCNRIRKLVNGDRVPLNLETAMEIGMGTVAAYVCGEYLHDKSVEGLLKEVKEDVNRFS